MLSVIGFVSTVCCYVACFCMTTPVLHFRLSLHELGPFPYTKFAFRTIVEFILLLHPCFCFVLHGAANCKITFTPVFLNTSASTRMRSLNEISFSHISVSVLVPCAYWVLICVTSL